MKVTSFTCWIFMLWVLSIAACSKVDLKQINNLNNNQISVVGHGGTGFVSIENSLPINSWESIRKAVEFYQVDGVEVDVQLDADRKVWLFHEEELALTTSCVGCLSDWTKKDLADCRYRKGQGMNAGFTHALVELDSVLNYFSNQTQRVPLFLDVSIFPDCWEVSYDQIIMYYAESLYQSIAQFDAQEWVYIETTDLSLIRELRRMSGDLQLVLTRQPDDQIYDWAKEYQLWGFSFNSDEVGRSDVERAHEAGIRVSLWNVRLRNAAVDAANKSPDFIQTDNIPLLQEILNQ